MFTSLSSSSQLLTAFIYTYAHLFEVDGGVWVFCCRTALIFFGLCFVHSISSLSRVLTRTWLVRKRGAYFGELAITPRDENTFTRLVIGIGLSAYLRPSAQVHRLFVETYRSAWCTEASIFVGNLKICAASKISPILTIASRQRTLVLDQIVCKLL